jgi:hypothetical protein
MCGSSSNPCLACTSSRFNLQHGVRRGREKFLKAIMYMQDIDVTVVYYNVEFEINATHI